MGPCCQHMREDYGTRTMRRQCFLEFLNCKMVEKESIMFLEKGQKKQMTAEEMQNFIEKVGRSELHEEL